MFDYETLRFIWWLLIGVILVVFMISDGFDMGIGCLLPLVARNDDERRIVINSVGAHWEGNQVWLILAGGALFAAWPRVYAAAFSGFYVAMILVLCSLFFRPLAFDYRGKIADARWRKMWDAGLVIGSLVPPVVFGIAFGNLLLGVPFAFTPQLRVEYLGSFWQLLTPFPLLCGLLSLGMVILQGGVWLQLKTVGAIHLRSQLATKRAALLVMLCFLLAGYWLWVGIDGFVLLAQDANGPSNPLMKLVAVLPGAWMNNFFFLKMVRYTDSTSFFCPSLYSNGNSTVLMEAFLFALHVIWYLAHFSYSDTSFSNHSLSSARVYVSRNLRISSVSRLQYVICTPISSRFFCSA